MTQPIENVLLQVSTVVGAVSGIVGAPQYPPENITYDPFAVTYLMNGTVGGGAVGTKRDLITVVIDVLIPKRVLDQDLAVLVPLIDPVTHALLAQISSGGSKFASSIDTFDEITLTFLPKVEYGAIEMTGYRFAMQKVRIQVAL